MKMCNRLLFPDCHLLLIFLAGLIKLVSLQGTSGSSSLKQRNYRLKRGAESLNKSQFHIPHCHGENDEVIALKHCHGHFILSNDHSVHEDKATEEIGTNGLLLQYGIPVGTVGFMVISMALLYCYLYYTITESKTSRVSSSDTVTPTEALNWTAT